MATHSEPTAVHGMAGHAPQLVGHAGSLTGPTSMEEDPVGSTGVSSLPQEGGGVDWERAYGQGYLSAYTAVASAVPDAVRTAGAGLDDLAGPSDRVWASLSALGDAASRAAMVGPDRARRRAGHSTGAEPPGALAWDGLRLRAAVDGALEAAREIVTGWRAAVPRRDRIAGVGDGTVTDWVHLTLAAANWKVVRRWLADGASASAATAGLSFAQPASTEGVAAVSGPAAEATSRSGFGGRAHEAGAAGATPAW